MKILACTEGIAGRLDPVSLEMIGASRALAAAADEVVAFFAGSGAETAAAALGEADRLVSVEADGDVLPAEAYGRLLHQAVAAEAADLVLVPYSANGLDLAADIAARLGWPLVAYVRAVARKDGGLDVTGQVYGGKVLADCRVALPAVLMVNPGVFAAAAAKPMDAGKVRRVDAGPVLATGRVRAVSVAMPEAGEVDLTAAERIVCVGRGIGDAGSIDLARELADKLDAEIAGSRPVIDNGWLPKPRQVGKSGRKVKPKLYLALGVSGAPEHLEGMARSDLIVAVNTDPNAPIFGVAHYGATCDLLDLVAELNERLPAAGG